MCGQLECRQRVNKMAKINVIPNCGNSPRKAFIRDFNIAFTKDNIDFIIDNVHENVQWLIYGDTKIDGKADFIKSTKGMLKMKIEEITIYNIITHGKAASCNGQMIMQGGKKFAFSDVYEFISAGKNVITKMYTYVLEDTF